MKILITGGTGSIGQELVMQLLESGEEVLCFDRNEEKAFYLEQKIKEQFPTARFKIHLGSITDSNRLLNVCMNYKPDIIYHTAANKHVPLGESNVKEFVKNNIQGTFNVMFSATLSKSKLVFISTDKAVEPASVMGYTKRMCELAILSSKMNAVICRFGNVQESSGSVLELFKQQEKTGILKVTHPDMERYFISLKNAVNKLIKCSELERGLYTFDMGNPVRINDIALNFGLPIEYIGLRPGEKIKENLTYPFETKSLIYKNGISQFIYKIEHPEINSSLFLEIFKFVDSAMYMDDEEIIQHLKILNNEV